MTDVNTIVERLLAELDAYAKDWRDRAASNKPVLEAAALIRSLYAENVDLRSSLEPFSIIGDVFTKQTATDFSPWATSPDDQKLYFGTSHMHVTIGDLRRARAAGRREG